MEEVGDGWVGGWEGEEEEEETCVRVMEAPQ